MEDNNKIRFKKLLTLSNVAQLAVVKSLLEDLKIPYYITNEYFSTLYGAADGLTRMDLFVEEENFLRAKEVLRDFL